MITLATMMICRIIMLKRIVMENPKITCPKCQSTFTLQSKSGQLETDWDNLGFSCSNCQQKIILNNVNSDTNRMKKIQFQYTCSNSDCNTINTIQVFESSVGKKVISTCKNCGHKSDILVPSPEKPISNEFDNAKNSPTNPTFINPENRDKEVKLILHIPATNNNREQQFEVNQMYMSIGRKSNTDKIPDIAIITEDTTMSRVHAIIKYHKKQNTYSIKDAGSTNKVFVNENKAHLKDLEEIIISNDDKIRLGKTILNVKIQ